MEKAFIIASCALIVALVIGATHESPITPAPTHFLLEQKCSESVKPAEPSQSDCALITDKSLDNHADMFLRNKKRKSRMAYA